MPSKYIKKKDRLKTTVETNTDGLDEIKNLSLPENQKEKEETAEQTAQRLSEQIPETKERKKYTKKTKEDGIFDESSFKPLITVGLHFINDRCPNPVEPTEPEIEMISKSVLECVNKYGGTIAEYMPLITLLGSTAMFLVPRLQTNKKEPVLL